MLGKLVSPFTTAAIMLCVASSAMAQDTGVVSQTSFLYDVWEIVKPMAVVIFATVSPVIAGGVIAVLYKLFAFLGIKDENEQKRLEVQFRDALHAAALNALKYAVAKRTGPIGDLITGTVPADLIRDAVDYVRSKNPDAAAAISDQNLVEIILSKVVDVQATVEAGKSGGGKY